MLAAIPYQTFPTIDIGPLQLRTFGLMVGLAVLSGSWVAATHAERFGIARDDIYRLATRMVLAGVVGARLTWDITHWDQIDEPIDLIAVWEGGLQFSGGFIVAVLVGLPAFMKWDRLTRWRVLDGGAMGLAIGVFFGRIGCTAVGEHFGGVTSFPLAVRWEGGAVPDVREPVLGLGADARPVTEGLVFHNTAVYEMIAVLILFLVLRVLYRRGVGVSTLSGVYLLGYAPSRFLFDAIRVNDERVAGLTGAQWMTLAIVPIAFWMLFWVRPRVHELELADAAASAVAGSTVAPSDAEVDAGAGPGVDGADVDAGVDAGAGAGAGAGADADADADAGAGVDAGAGAESDAERRADDDTVVATETDRDADAPVTGVDGGPTVDAQEGAAEPGRSADKAPADENR